MEWLLSGTPAVYLTAIGFLVFMLLVVLVVYAATAVELSKSEERLTRLREMYQNQDKTLVLRTQALEHAEEKAAMLEKELGVVGQVKPLDIGKGY